jgi:hypothetical protein
MGREDCGYVHLSFLRERKGYTREPFVEVSNHSTVLFSGDELYLLAKLEP